MGGGGGGIELQGRITRLSEIYAPRQVITAVNPLHSTTDETVVLCGPPYTPNGRIVTPADTLNNELPTRGPYLQIISFPTNTIKQSCGRGGKKSDSSRFGQMYGNNFVPDLSQRMHSPYCKIAYCSRKLPLLKPKINPVGKFPVY